MRQFPFFSGGGLRERKLALFRQRRRRGLARQVALMLGGGVAAGLAIAMSLGTTGEPSATATAATAGIATAPSPPGSATAARFGYCHSGGGTNCVVDGDTFRMDGVKIRVADIDAPETHPSRCAEEARLGDAATARLQELLNAGPVTLEPIDRDTDLYGRELRIVTRDGRSLGEALVAEGLARRWSGRRMPWC